MEYSKNNILGHTVWIIKILNSFDNYDLLLSKVSEALNPLSLNNQIGEGGTMLDFLTAQPEALFVINGGFNHYRKNFYSWPHNNFNIGDPVGLVKIREHYYEDFLDINSYGFFVQQRKKEPWKIIKNTDIDKSFKYILGCTPLLIFEKDKTILNDEMRPVSNGLINPPSYLGHGLQQHPRSAVGIKDEYLYFIIVEQNEVSNGCTLFDLQDIGYFLNLEYFLNLDGGGSTQFYFKDHHKKEWIHNYILDEDKHRVLGNVIALFNSKQ